MERRPVRAEFGAEVIPLRRNPVTMVALVPSRTFSSLSVVVDKVEGMFRCGSFRRGCVVAAGSTQCLVRFRFGFWGGRRLLGGKVQAQR
jgi:hypothetical protein